MRFRCALPNQFRCQTSLPSCQFDKRARPKAVGNLPEPVSKGWTACFQIGVTSMAAIGKQRTSSGGAERDRTADPLLAKQVLSQLSYSPTMGACCRDGGPG